MENKKTISICIDIDRAGIRLDKAIADIKEVGSRSQATRLIDLGYVRFNGKIVKPSHKTEVGQSFEIEIPDVHRTDLLPLDLDLDVAFEDEHLLVINKPAGLVVHPACGHEQDTLVNALIHHSKNLSSGFEDGRPGIVHRLDKDTSGLIVVAKNDHVHRELAKQFKQKSVHRIYWAICNGPFKEDNGRIESFLKRHPQNRKKISSERVAIGHAPTGKNAITHYQVKKEISQGLCLVHLKLETGRTHQIRVHMSEQGNPIVGDPIYGRKKENPLASSAPHLMLHAAELGFIHPETKIKLMLSADWPEETHPLLKTLGAL